MKITPLLMKGPLVLASLRGDKTQTRRLSGLDEVNADPDGWTLGHVGRLNCPGHPHHGKFGAAFRRSDYSWFMPCPYGRPGDLLWVRESWADVGGDPWYMADGRERSYSACDTFEGGGYPPVCRDIGANCCSVTRQKVRWSPSIHMPRWASRQTLRITDVRVQRLQEISEADATAEGTQEPSLRELSGDLAQAAWTERQVFQRLWDSINAARGFGWSRNPWVWALTYQAIAKNVDQVIREQEIKCASNA